jgi:hypothetical protein
VVDLVAYFDIDDLKKTLNFTYHHNKSQILLPSGEKMVVRPNHKNEYYCIVQRSYQGSSLLS